MRQAVRLCLLSELPAHVREARPPEWPLGPTCLDGSIAMQQGVPVMLRSKGFDSRRQKGGTESYPDSPTATCLTSSWGVPYLDESSGLGSQVLLTFRVSPGRETSRLYRCWMGMKAKPLCGE